MSCRICKKWQKETVKNNDTKQPEKSDNVISKLKGFFAGFGKK